MSIRDSTINGLNLAVHGKETTCAIFLYLDLTFLSVISTLTIRY